MKIINITQELFSCAVHPGHSIPQKTKGFPMKMIDITQELFSCKVYPGDPSPQKTLVRQMPKDGCNLTNMSLCVHNGTHIDAPSHFIEGGKTIDQLPLEIFYGDCVVLECQGVVEAYDIQSLLDEQVERLLLKGDCQLSEEAAEAIARSYVCLIGIESQSIDSAGAGAKIHRILLGEGIIPLEGLRLSHVKPGEYILSAFPLHLAGCEGSPVRAILIEEEYN